jgi:TetR/AcrR family transcriptional regulator, transcriptional repressor for nem operon
VAIEADDASPVLRRGAIKILDMLRDSLITILDKGIKYKQIKADVDKTHYAAVIIASLEGAIMMSKLRGNDDDIRRVIVHLDKQIELIEL